MLVKRFSAKEERKRIVAVVYNSNQITNSEVGFENHLNYYHFNGCGLPLVLARGLSIFLNSTIVDTYFRQFSGHTQINALDLRHLQYPTKKQLVCLAEKVPDSCDDQQKIDLAIDEVLFRKS